jgi:hypothetical protein
MLVAAGGVTLAVRDLIAHNVLDPLSGGADGDVGDADPKPAVARAAEEGRRSAPRCCVVTANVNTPPDVAMGSSGGVSSGWS